MKRNLNKKWSISFYTYMILLGVSMIITLIVVWTLDTKYFWTEILYKTKSFYAAETGIEEWLLSFKKVPDIDQFIPNERVIQETRNNRTTEYTEQKVYKKELVIKETIEAGKSIQLPFKKKDLDSRITQFHIAILTYDTENPPVDQNSCDTPVHDSSLEISAFQKANIISTDPLDYTVELNSNWNGCYIWNNSVGKTSLIKFSDPYSKKKVSLVWDKCIMNSNWNVSGAVFESDIPYVFDDKGDSDLSNNTCEYDCGSGGCSKFYTHNSEVAQKVKWALKFYTIAPNFIWGDMTNDGLIMFDFRAINDDVEIAVWATDDDWNPYEIPWRFVNFSALGVWHWGDIKEWLYTRLKLKKKANNDLLPIFDYTLFSESEFIK